MAADCLSTIMCAGLVIGLVGLPIAGAAFVAFFSLGDIGSDSERYLLPGDSQDEKAGRKLVDGVIGNRKRYVSAYMSLVSSLRQKKNTQPAAIRKPGTKIAQAGTNEPDAQSFAVSLWKQQEPMS